MAHSLVSDKRSTAAQGGSLPTDNEKNISVEPLQLQLLVYETGTGNMTLAERLEKSRWEK